MAIKMVATSVAVSGERAVVSLQALPDPDDDYAGGGTAQFIINDPDDIGDFEEGAVYNVTLRRTRGTSPHAVAAEARAAAAAIPNSTNTRHYVTPAHLKVPPMPVPDGVVTEPRPSVVLEPVTDTPPTAGVAAPAPSVTEAAEAGTAEASKADDGKPSQAKK